MHRSEDSDYDDWARRMAEAGSSVAEVRVGGEVIYACAKDMSGRVVAVWNPDAMDSPFHADPCS